MNDLQVIDYSGVRVLTTEQLAQAYECETTQIQQNFINNKSHFEKGKHYFKLTGDELKVFKASLGDSKISSTFKFTSALMLWTRRGASRHCKMLGTEKAWEMYDNLEENYFNPPQKKMTAAEILSGMAEELVKQERRTARLEMRQERNEENFKILNSRMDTFNGIGTDEDKRQKLNSMIRAFSLKAGMRFDEGWRNFIRAYNTAFHANVNLLITKYMEKNHIQKKKRPTTPEYFERAGLLDDALAVADKLLNGAHAHSAIDSILKHS